VGAIELPAEITESVMPGVVCVPHGFGHDRAGVQLRVARKEAAGASLNDITDELQVDALTGTAVLNGLPVQVQADSGTRLGRREGSSRSGAGASSCYKPGWHQTVAFATLPATRKPRMA
jgi:hypothetical protein